MSHQFDVSIDMFCNNWHCFSTINRTKAYNDGSVKKYLLGRVSADDKKPNQALLSWLDILTPT